MSGETQKSVYKPDYDIIISWVNNQSRILDLGCGDGSLLERLINEKKVSGVGVENDEESLNASIAKGLSVIQIDINKGLLDFPDKSFDFVILNDTLQALHHPLKVLQEMLRIGKKVVVGFPNFAHIIARSYLFFNGRMPMSKTLPYMWYNTPNIHFMTVKDFKLLCSDQNIKIIKERYFGEHLESVMPIFANLLASEAVFLIEKQIL
ncbi:methionine biosynthesis protein MetW [Candidatus Margulisiibacteriota bacterium]